MDTPHPSKLVLFLTASALIALVVSAWVAPAADTPLAPSLQAAPDG